MLWKDRHTSLRQVLALVAGLALVGFLSQAVSNGDDVKPDAPKAESPNHGAHKGHDKKDPTKRDAHGQGKKKEPSAMDHVLDSDEFHIFDVLFPQHIHLPKIYGLPPLRPQPEGQDPELEGFQISKFMVLEVIAAILIILIYVPLAQKLKNGEVPTGAFANCFEVLLTFVREEIAKPSLAGHEEHHDDHGHDALGDHDHAHGTGSKHSHGHTDFGGHPADKYVPFLWTLFLFILFNNLLGMFPFMGSATSSIFVTGGLAIVVFFAMHGSAIAKMGFGGYLGTMWPHIDVPGAALQFVIRLMVCVIEVVGLLVKNGVLAVRLFANMFAGHMVLATILLFIKVAGNSHPLLWSTITLSSVVGILALSMLELFVAFLQAYIFTFLTALFMGMAINPQH